MSHEVENMIYVGEVPWHRLGKRVRPGLSSHDFMHEAELDWRVDVCPCWLELPNGERIHPSHVPHYALVRSSDHKVLAANVRGDYRPLQNRKLFDFLQRYVESGLIQMDTAGSLYGGRMVWALGKIVGTGTYEVTDGDKIEPYLLLNNPHDGKRAAGVRLTSIRVVCQNTLNFALSRQGNRSKIWSSRYGNDLDDAHGMVERALREHKRLLDWARRAAEVKFRMGELVAFFDEAFPRRSGQDKRKSTETMMQWLGIKPNMTYKDWQEHLAEMRHRYSRWEKPWLENDLVIEEDLCLPEHNPLLTGSGRVRERAQRWGAKRGEADESRAGWHPANPKGRLSTAETAILKFLPNQLGVQHGEGTWWHALNTVTYMVDHELCRSPGARWYSSAFGPNNFAKVRAYKLVQQQIGKQA